MIFGEWDNEKMKEVVRKNAYEDGEKKTRDYVLNLFAQGLTGDEVKQRLEQENMARRLLI